MELENNTPCPAIAWKNLDSEGNENITTLVRGKFKFHPTMTKGLWELRFDPNQGDLIGSDEFYNDDTGQSIRYESDFVVFKERTDVIINCTARSPGKQPRKDWLCGVKISDEENKICLEKWLQVTGKRHWKRDLLGWALSDIEAVTEVPIRYENTFGGEVVKREPDRDDQYFKVCYSNPIGIGLLHRKHPEKVVAAPQILSPDDPLDQILPYNTYTPQGFGFYHRAWDLRLPLAGTYDEDWQENQWPLPPHDFDQAFNQAAHPNMIVDGYLQGDETVTLYKLLPGKNKQQFRLPSYSSVVEIVVNGEPYMLPLDIDTLLLDIDSNNSEDWSVYISWRIRVRYHDKTDSITAHMVSRESLEKMEEST